MSAMSEKEYYQLNVSVSKALNMMEAPLKLKHARAIIITTHRTKEAKSFWAIISTQPLMENRFTAWKFCHLLHKVLREGHHSAIKQSQSHKSMLIEMGKLWGHLHDGVGSCIQAYTKLLVTKLDFHDKNAFLPGSLSVPFSHIERFAGDDINVYFQLGVEIFDYLEAILEVQVEVFRSVDMYRMSSMSQQGQCRLAPLITLIQDSNALYDFCVRLLFKLHHNLPNDVLSGHRDRFREMFSKLKIFYDRVRPLQYFADLIQVPILPESAPNFTSKVDFGNYIPPVVTVPEPEPEPEVEPATERLVDLSVSNENYSTTDSSERERETINNYEQAIRAKDMALQTLESQLDNLRGGYNAMEGRYQQEITELRNEIRQLHAELKSSNETVEKVEKVKQDLELQIASSNTLSKKAVESEEKAKLSEEKFLKLKTMYSEMREEHIKLLRQNGETKKQLNQEKQLNEELKAEHLTILAELQSLRNKSETSSQAEKDLQSVLEEKSNQMNLLQEQLRQEKQLIADLKAEHSTVLVELKSLREKSDVSSNEKVNLERILEEKSKQLESLQEEHEKLKQGFDDIKATEGSKSTELAKTKDKLIRHIRELQMTKDLATELEGKLEETKITSSRKIEEHQDTIAQLNKNLEAKDVFINELKEAHLKSLEKVTTERDETQGKLAVMSNTLQNKVSDYEQLHEQMKELCQNNKALEAKCADVRMEKEVCEKNSKNLISSIMSNIFRTTRSVVALNFNESGQQRFERSFQILEEIQKLLDELPAAYRLYKEEGSNEKFVQVLLMLCYQMCMLREVCMLVYNTTTDLEEGQKIFDLLLYMAEPIEKLFAGVQDNESHQTLEGRTVSLKSNLLELENVLRGLTKQVDSNAELGDIIESELAEMEKAIAEAAEKFVELLSHTRSNDDGIKLEVNEKILDACTNLMECIKRLIKQSKILQDEIVSTGRGRISAKEFYKRNSEWTEGLISASKSVAKGANLLVEAANKAVGSDSSKSFEIIVAAQEIAACTAQLVISSKVKAPKDSSKLQDLTKASRMVSQATGAVVAIVKDSNQRLENYSDVDLSKLTASQAKTMEMDIHVRVLELEQALQMERLKLCAFRRNLYQNSEN